MDTFNEKYFGYFISISSKCAILYCPPIAAVFLLGIFYKRINSYGALSVLIGGFVIGMARIFLEINKESLSGILFTFADINFLYFCIILFGFSIIILIGVSLLTPKPSEEQLNGLTYSTTVAEDKSASRASWTTSDLVLSLFVVVIIAAIFIYFSPIGVGG